MSDQNANPSRPQKRKRARPLPAHVNARNLATEKRKRNEMKDSLLDLARLVPPLATARRLNKVVIITESIKYFQNQKEVCMSAAADMQDMIEENRRLVSELNALRAEVGGPLVEARPVTEAMSQFMEIKDAVYGTFPNGFGESSAVEPVENQRSRSGTADQELQLSMDELFPSPEVNYLDQLSSHDERNLMPAEVPLALPLSLPQDPAQDTAWDTMPSLDIPQPPSLSQAFFTHPIHPSDNTFDGNLLDSTNVPAEFWPPDYEIVDMTAYLQHSIEDITAPPHIV
ncbi:hypothetical protein CkaCkLH20_10211 [Colletotrichum karsti]|uniref:BHLH domain-containing protein n=1 Tax=Colletotrichum karsti TaxID=1095194 RepID=A0A9P6LDV2_9PEZI|nr:uncharacterized protein CkaCkLH20_10211 [Colletotrichum karsti]KAF9872384.1 hypothetical protein CkaCkLH20_10211 [Colletotrichum karsti]